MKTEKMFSVVIKNGEKSNSQMRVLLFDIDTLRADHRAVMAMAEIPHL